MAIVNLVPTKMLLKNTEYTTPSSVAVGADGMEIDFTGKDFKILIEVDTAAAVITAGDGIQGVAPLTVGIGKCVVLESGAFKYVNGAHKGKVFISGAATAKVKATELP